MFGWFLTHTHTHECNRVNFLRSNAGRGRVASGKGRGRETFVTDPAIFNLFANCLNAVGQKKIIKTKTVDRPARAYVRLYIITAAKGRGGCFYRYSFRTPSREPYTI